MFAIPHEKSVKVYKLENLQLKYELNLTDNQKVDCLTISSDQEYLVLVLSETGTAQKINIFNLSQGKYVKKVQSKIPHIISVQLTDDNCILFLRIEVESDIKIVTLDMSKFEVGDMMKVCSENFATRLSPLENAFYTLTSNFHGSELDTIEKRSYSCTKLAELNCYSPLFKSVNLNNLPFSTSELLTELDNFTVLGDGSLLLCSWKLKKKKVDVVFFKINKYLNEIEIINYLHVPVSLDTEYDSFGHFSFSSDNSECYIQIDTYTLWVYDIETWKLKIYDLTSYSQPFDIEGCYKLETITKDYIVFTDYEEEKKSVWFSQKSDQISEIDLGTNQPMVISE